MELDKNLMDLSTMMEVDSEDVGERQGYPGIKERLQHGPFPPKEQHQVHVVEADKGGGLSYLEMKDRLFGQSYLKSNSAKFMTASKSKLEPLTQPQ